MTYFCSVVCKHEKISTLSCCISIYPLLNAFSYTNSDICSNSISKIKIPFSMFAIFLGLWSYVYWYIRPALKWFLRKTTRLCELQRICYGEEFGYLRASKVETCLVFSRVPEIQQMVYLLNDKASQGRFTENTSRNCIEYAVRLTIDIKEIKPKIHMPFIEAYHICLFQIYGYKQLQHEIEVVRKIPYSSDNQDHETKLLQLWNLLQPEEELQSRISKQWGNIGFQGDDPKTDFRGMGVLGLENLLFFASQYSKAARHVLLHSHHPNYGYSFAIVGINLTSMAYHLLKDNYLQVHFYNTVKGRPYIHHFHYVYCYLFYEFDKFWLAEKPRDIMEFNRIRTKFEEYIRKKLENPQAKLKLSFQVEVL